MTTKPLRFVTNYGAPHPKRRRITAACLTCRKRKTACSGEKPHCDTCKQNRVECAGYATDTSEARTSSSKHRDSIGNSDQLKRTRTSNIDPGLRPRPADHKPAQRQNVPDAPIPATTDRNKQFLFPGLRNRMPYFRWLGPTAIMPGFKQMVVKVKRRDTDAANSSADGAAIVSPPIHQPSPLDQRSLTGANVDSLPLNLPFYDTSSVPPSELITHLAQTFFTHLGCNFPFLPRERFLRDLEEKQVDAILVDAVCALAARFSTHPLLATQSGNGDVRTGAAEYGHAFAQRGKSALTETFVMPTVAAAQAALLLAYNEFGESRDSGLWVYLGIAIRLAQDLGMQKVEGLRFRGISGPTPSSVKSQAARKAMAKDKSTERTSPRDETTVDDMECQIAGEQERIDTFWAIFFLDRVVSSGTGRRSTLRDKDIELSFPPLDQIDAKTGWPAPFPALIRIVHLYGCVADLLNSIKEPGDITPDTSKRLAAMESQVTSFYQGLSKRLHFDAVNFQHYVTAGEGTNFVLLHFWFHTLIVLLHQPTLLKTFEGKLLQLFPNSQQLSMSSAKTIADILSYSQLIDAKASLGNPFTTQPIYIAACAFLRERAEHAATSNSQSRVASPSRQHATSNSHSRVASPSRQHTPSTGLPRSADAYDPHDERQPAAHHNATSSREESSRTSATPTRRAVVKHTLLATAASQHYQLCYKALQSLEKYWAGTKYILTVLDQKFEGVGDPVLYTAEESECAMEQPTKDPAFTTPGWRRNSRLTSSDGLPSLETTFWEGLQRAERDPLATDPAKAIGWTMTGTMNSPSTNLAIHYPHGPQQESATKSTDLTQQVHPGGVAPGNFNADASAMSDASLLLGLHSPFDATSAVNQGVTHAGNQPNVFLPDAAQRTITPNGMWIETQDVDMSMLGLDMMPWFDTLFGSHDGDMSMYDMSLADASFPNGSQ